MQTRSKTLPKNVKSEEESIEIMDSDEEDPLKVPAKTDNKPSNPTAVFKLPNPPATIAVKNSQVQGIVKFRALQCVYCGKQNSDKITLAKHMIADHWAQVRERQGGGRRNNDAYYANIEDSRVIKPTFKAPVLAPKPPGSNLRPLAPKPIAPAAAMNSSYLNSNPKWLNKLGSNGNKVNKISRNIHNPSWYGKAPNRKIVPKISTLPFGMTFDLTKDDPDACDVCDDDFNWPDENHECKRTLKKQQKVLNSSTSPIPDTKKILKELPFKNNKEQKIQKLVSTLNVKKLPANSRGLQIIPVKK